MKCPDGHRWWKCRHPELAHPVLGAALMGAGLIHILIAIVMVTQ